MKLNILLVCNKPQNALNANTILDHIEAFEKYSRHVIWTYSNVGDFSSRLDLDRFDVIVVHYSISLLYDYFLTQAAKEQLRKFSGLKVLFVQDEYRQINKMIAEIDAIHFDVLFTCFPDGEIERIYPASKLPTLAKYNNLTGYIPEQLLEVADILKIKERPVEVGYRGRDIPYWLGELAYEKWSIVDRWNEHTQDANLKTDISCREQDRIYGREWVRFLSSCKTTLGVESGASVMDFTGELEQQVNAYQDIYPNASFHEIQKLFLLEHEGQYKLNQISPRCFEAIALKTVLVLYEGEYSGILTPGRHYIMLKKDFSNIEEVLGFIKDDEFLQRMADTAYQEIALNPQYSYKYFVNQVDKIIELEFKERAKKVVLNPYEGISFKSDINYRPWLLKIKTKVHSYLSRKMNSRSIFNYVLNILVYKVKIFNPLLRFIKRAILN